MAALNTTDLPRKKTEHPWTKTIKDSLSRRIKYSHNSIRNPIYPVKENKQAMIQLERDQFTIIGDRVTKPFIYCSNLVKGLHKYRPKNFHAPVIRGVTTVDWTNVLHDLKLRYGTPGYCLLSSVAVLMNNNLIGGEEDLKQLVESKYYYHLCLDYYNEGVAEFAKFIRSTDRPFAYLHVSIDDEHIGTLIFMLYADVAPLTCANFLRLCKERRGGYSGTPIHRIVKDGWIQCGGFGLKNTPLSCENFIVSFDRRGVLAMANDGRDYDCSTQFFVLLQPSMWMTHKYVAFGQLVEGEETLKKIENVATWFESPTSNIILYRCGVLNLECRDKMYDTGAVNEYINSHIENLTEFIELVMEGLLEKVFLEAQMNALGRLREQAGEGKIPDDAIGPTQRFKKEDIEKHFDTNQADTSSGDNDFDVEEYEIGTEGTSDYRPTQTRSRVSEKENKMFYLPLTDVPYLGDVDSDFDLKRFLKGDYCHEIDLDKHHSNKVINVFPKFPSEILLETESVPVIPNSEDELDTEDEKEINEYLAAHSDRVSFAGDIVKSIAKKKTGKFNLFADMAAEDRQRSDTITDEKLRKIRLASIDWREKEQLDALRVLIRAPQQTATQIHRKQTGYVLAKDLEEVQARTEKSDYDDGSSDSSKTVRIDAKAIIKDKSAPYRQVSYRRPTGFIRPQDLPKFGIHDDNDDDDNDVDEDNDDADDDDGDDNNDHHYKVNDKARISINAEVAVNITKQDYVLDDVFDDNVDYGEYPDKKKTPLTKLLHSFHWRSETAPTLKDFVPMAERQSTRLHLTYSPLENIRSYESAKRARYMRHPSLSRSGSVKALLEIQHGKKITRKISTDYVKTIEKVEDKVENSIRTVEFARKRPTITVSEYKQRNLKYLQGISNMNSGPIKEILPQTPSDEESAASIQTHVIVDA